MTSELETSLMFACQVEKWNKTSQRYEPARSPLNHPLTTGQEAEFSGLIIRLEEHQFSIRYTDKPVIGVGISEERPDDAVLEEHYPEWKEFSADLITGENVLLEPDGEFTITEIAPGEINPVQQLIITKPVKPTNPYPDRLVISQPQFIKEGNPGRMLL